ncbi:MAG: cytochrome c3 family protein, partial [Nitrospinota bacterium]|nr:cytochrome c3 family protein [Nitrospinota bacterium]
MPALFKLKSTICLAVFSLLFVSTIHAQEENRVGATVGITGNEEQCLSCHKGIEEISRSHPLNLGCTSCHGGNAASEDKKEAHATLIY